MDRQWSSICDAHAHPHDDRENISRLGELVKTGRLNVMGTRMDDLDIVAKSADDFKEKVVPFFGLHPWFVYGLSLKDVPDKELHYRSVLVNTESNKTSTDKDSLGVMINSLPSPIPLSDWLTTVENFLIAHPHSHLGEVGLDALAKLLSPTTRTPTKIQTSMDHQIAVLEKQLDLAAKHNRSVSLHCVRSSGHFISLIQSKFGKQHPLPPRICIHSYSGSVDTIKVLTQSTKTKKFPVDMYFSFSSILNGRHKRFPELVRAVPEERLLIESDFHSPIGLDGLMQEIVEAVGTVKDWTSEETVERTHANFMRFIGEG